MFHNLYDYHVKGCVQYQKDTGDLTDPQEIAECIANKAKKFSMDPKYLSPLAKNVSKEGE